MSGQACDKLVGQGFFWRACGKLAVSVVDGHPLCKTHAAGHKRRLANIARTNEKRAALHLEAQRAAALQAAKDRVVEAALAIRTVDALQIKGGLELDRARSAYLALRDEEGQK